MDNKEKDIENKIIEILDQLKPFVNADGGDMEFVSFKDRIVYIRLLGNCVGCGLIDTTYKDGIENILFSELPDYVDGVELVM
ncbi:NifU family protein [Spiroplasma endosymbiont of Aspidapion aeneum]|uniref:NifU family protein n=1 Tax=Spiroplasma endosymbiont of Aspidapion aeneum TaxID=3066276 RepID=UPI00313B1A93